MDGDLDLEHAENERRSVAMLPPEGPSWWPAKKAWKVLDQLVRLLAEKPRAERP